jgi:hypothetical protein
MCISGRSTWLFVNSRGSAALQTLTAWHVLVADEKERFVGLVKYANILLGAPFGNISSFPELDLREQ